ncbi:MAG: sigma-70 family RNA polymerase sigma factor, partial [Phycisphaerales bacterium]
LVDASPDLTRVDWYSRFYYLITMFETRATLLMRLKADTDAREFAWAEFCTVYEPIIAGFARRGGLPSDQIPDLVQQVLTGFFAVQPRFMYDPSTGRFRSYLKTCVINELRRIRQRDAAAREREQEHARLDGESDARWDAEWERQQLNLALERLRAHYKDNATFAAFHAVVVLGRSPEDVATELGLSRDSVYQARTRLLARLRLELADVAAKMGE